MIRSITLTVCVRLLMIVAALASSIVTARLLGPEGRGLFFYWSTVAGIAMQFGNLGLHSSNTYYLSRDDALWSPLAANALACALGVGCVTMCILFGLEVTKGTVGNTWPFALSAAGLAAFGLYFMLGTNLLVARSRFGEFNLFEISNRYLALACIALAAWYWQSATAALLASAAAASISCLPLYARMRSLGASTWRPDFTLLKRGFSYAMRAYLVGLIGFMLLRVNTFMLEHYTSHEELGRWSIAAQILDIINILPSAVGLILFPTILRSANPYTLMVRSLAFAAAALFLASLGAVAFGEFFITLLYGEDFAVSYTVLLWGLPGTVALGCLTVASQFLASTGIPKRLLLVWIAGLAVEIAIAFWLVPSQGAHGAMIAFSVAHIVVFAFAWRLVQDQRRRVTPS